MKGKNILKFIILILMFFLGGVVLGAIFNSFGLNVSSFDAKDNNYFQCLAEIVFSIVVYLLYRKCLKEDLKDLKENKNKYIEEFIKLLILFFVIKIASALLTSIIDLIFNMNLTESENQSIIIELMESGPLMMIISTVFFAPIVEEGIFRLSLGKIINNKKVFIIVSGVLFGFMHIFPTDLAVSVALTYSITYVAMGIYLAYAYAKTENIWMVILLHAANNLLSMLAILFLS